MFFLKLFLVALAANTFNLISAEDTTAQKIGWTGTLSSLDGGLMGTVVVVDATTIMINNYQLLDASAPALHWWGSTDGMLKDGFRVSQTQVTQKSTSNTLTINLDAGKTTADFTTFGLWCESFKANFGQTTLAAATTGGSAGSSTSGSTSSSATSASPTTSAKTGGGDGLSVGHSVSLAGFAALFVVNML